MSTQLNTNYTLNLYQAIFRKVELQISHQFVA